MTTPLLSNKYVEPELRHIDLSKFEIRKEKEAYHKEQLEIEEEESDKFTSLVESIRDVGILSPIYVIETKNNTFEVVDGGRRLRAAKFLELPTVPAMIFSRGVNETEIRKRALIANIQRKDLTQEEKGEGLAQYYKSGGVDPEHAISYLNTLRQRKQNKDQDERFGLENKPNLGGRPKFKEVDDLEEYERFLELHKKLGIKRITQYDWMVQVVYIPPEIRKSENFRSLPVKDQRHVTASEVRNKPEAQKQMVDKLASIEKGYEKAKQKRKEENVKWTVDEFRLDEQKQDVLKEYIPTYRNDKEITIGNFANYGEVNGCISKLWTALTMGIKRMPLSTDDLLNDHIKPTRKDFKEYATALGEAEIIQQYEWMIYVQKVLDDRLKIMKELINKNK